MGAMGFHTMLAPLGVFKHDSQDKQRDFKRESVVLKTF